MKASYLCSLMDHVMIWKMTGSEQECCAQLLVAQAQEMLGSFVEAMCCRTYDSTTVAM